MKKLVSALLLLSSLSALLSILPITSTSAYAAPCYGASCIGLDPVKYCSNDAITVASEAVVDQKLGYAGQIDLRYSRSCAANWGRFSATFGKREVIRFGLLSLYYVDDGAISAWNPGQPSQKTIWSEGGSVVGLFRQTRWTYMVDGTKKACVGVRPHYITPVPSDHGDFASWFEGPCF